MTSLLLRVAIASALTVATMVGIVAVSGTVIFADIKTEPTGLVPNSGVASGDKPPTFSGPLQ